MSDSNSHRQLLVRCIVSNSDEERSIRFVAHSVYRLWQYMMADRHGIRVAEAALGLWLPESEWESHGELFAHAGAGAAAGQNSDVQLTTSPEA